MKFKDRKEAGRKLAEKLKSYQDQDAVVYSLPRGGTVLGAEIAKTLNTSHDLIITRKIGHPNSPEYAICAVGARTEPLCNEVERARVEKDWFDRAVGQQRAEIKRRQRTYLKGRKAISAGGKTAIVVDDGIATGFTMRVAIRELRSQEPREIIVAVPVVPPDTAETIRAEADELVALDIPAVYAGAVGAYYDKFPQTTDEEVIELLNSK